MKSVLRSIIDFEGVSQRDLIENFQRLASSKLDFLSPQDASIFEYVKHFFHTYYKIPSNQSLLDFFEGSKDLEAAERVKDLETARPYLTVNYSNLVATKLEEQNKMKLAIIAKTTQDIATKGVIIDGERRVGLRESIIYFNQNAHQLLTHEHNSRIEGNLREDGQEVWNEYEDAEANKHLAWGKFTGLNNIDKVVRGIKKGELHLHAAFTGELKTSFAMNWCYNLITRYRSNVQYISMEMPYEQLRRMIYVMHTENPKFTEQGYKPLSYDKVCAGSLTPEEKDFFKIVIEDFCTCPEYGAFDVWSPDEDVTTDDIKMKAELKHHQNPTHLLVLDHGGLIEPRKKKRSKDYVVELNSVLRDAKKIALHFNHGEKIPVLLLFQINRDGKDQADKAEGRYKLRALSYANEAERSADIITTTYLNDDHRKAGTTLFDCIKRRDGAPFQPFIARVSWDTRRIMNHDTFHGAADNGMSVDDNKTVQDMMFNINI